MTVPLVAAGDGRTGMGEPRLAAHAPWWRELVLPVSAVAFLLAGAAFWALTHTSRSPGSAALAARVWYVGLLITGLPVLLAGTKQALRGHFATDLVASLSVLGALLLAEPLAGLVIVVMQSGGEALERIAEGRASAAVRELEAASPRVAHRLRAGVVEDVAVDLVAVGDELLVRPGEMIPCDVVVRSGRSPVDVSRLTGEPLPVDAVPGTVLSSGSANGDAPLTVQATALARESQYARIVELVRSAQATKAPLQRLADRYAVWFTPVTLTVCAIAWYWSGDPRRALAVLVVATPCPLILATPIALIGGINRAARRQIIIRNGGALERLAAATMAVFDKTGTLTLGRPAVAQLTALSTWDERALLRYAGAVERDAAHLLARSFCAEASARLQQTGDVLPPATSVTETSGRGAAGVVEGHHVAVGAWSYVIERVTAAPEVLASRQAADQATPGLRAYIAIDGAIAGVVDFADRLRDDAIGVMTALDTLGVHRRVLLSGDQPANVDAIALQAGFTEAHGEFHPADKARFIEALVHTGDVVLMVGDGINDAPALTAASVGIALAAHGGGISAEAADIVLLADHLGRVPEAIAISRRTIRIARQSIVVGLGLSVVAMIGAALGFLRPALGAGLQELIDVAVIVNALRSSRGSAGPVQPA